MNQRPGRAPLWLALALLSTLGLSLNAQAQDIRYRVSDGPSVTQLTGLFSGLRCRSDCCCDCCLPQKDIAEPGEDPAMPSEAAPDVAPLGLDVAAAFAPVSAQTNLGGYIDGAIVQSQVRQRFDAAYENPFPDRAEFFYAQCGCFGPPAPGPPMSESGVDYQELETYIELAWNNKISGFVEIPIRFINPDNNANHAGLSDIRAGFRYALINDCCRHLTFQLRIYTPTGDGNAGLGTEHASIEPALLFQREMDRLTVFGEFRVWIPTSGSVENFPTPSDPERDFSGEILRYGLGVGYDVYRSCDCCDPTRLTLVGEFVGWTILDGLKFRSDDPSGMGLGGNVFESASNDTIINAKLGARWTRGVHSLFAGYGRSLTEDVWYEDIMRAEYTYRF